MCHIIDDTNPIHPCHGKSCTDCETCIFDEDIMQPKTKPTVGNKMCGQLVKCFTGYQCEGCEFNEVKETNKNKTMNETCNKCPNLIKNFIDDGRLVFNACCGKVIIDYSDYTRPRVIKYKTGQMLQIDTPDWCPKKHGIDKQVLKPIGNAQYSDEDESQLSLPARVAPPSQDTPKQMTYYEKREAMKKLPSHLKWDDIKENEVFVIPKILNQARKVIKILMKTDAIIRYNEINEYGVESSYCGIMYPNDIEAVFITKIHKY